MQTLNPEKDKDSDWSQSTGTKISTRDETYSQLLNSDIQIAEFDKTHLNEAFKKRSFTEWQENNFGAHLLLQKNRVAEKLKQAKLELKEKQDSCSRSGTRQTMNCCKVIVSDKS